MGIYGCVLGGIFVEEQLWYACERSSFVNFPPPVKVLGRKKGIASLATLGVRTKSSSNQHSNMPTQMALLDYHCLIAARWNTGGNQVTSVCQIEPLPVTAQSVTQATRKDPDLSKVLCYTKEGWPAKVSKELKAYASRKNEITIEAGCLLWGIQVIVPKPHLVAWARQGHRRPG